MAKRIKLGASFDDLLAKIRVWIFFAQAGGVSPDDPYDAPVMASHAFDACRAGSESTSNKS